MTTPSNHPVATPQASTSSTFITARERDAYFVIRGFLFQVERTVQSWLRLVPGEMLELECGEDLDHLSRVLVDGTWREERMLEQIKNREKNITLRGGCEAMANFAEHRKSNPTGSISPDLSLRFRFTTNAQTTVERPSLMDGQRAGIELWRDVAQERVEASARMVIVSAIRTFLLDCQKPDKLPEETWADFHDFVEHGSEAEWLDFIKRFEWLTGNTPALELSAEIQGEMLEGGAVTTSEDARAAYERLFVHVLFLISQRGSKRLEAGEWRNVAARSLDADARLWLERLNADMVALATRLDVVETRADRLEEVTSNLSAQVITHERRFSQNETVQSTSFSVVFEKQDTQTDSLTALHAKVDALQRTHTVEELKNLPEWQESTLDLRLADIRQLLNDGKVRTAKTQLERLRLEIEALGDRPAKTRLKSGVLGQIGFCEWRLGDLTATVRLYREAYELQPDDNRTVVNAGFAALICDESDDLESNHLEEALSLGRQALERDAASDDGLSVAARALNRLNRDNEIAPLLVSYPVAAKGVQALFTLGAIALERGEYAPAQDYARRACEIAPDNPNLQRLRCDAHFAPIQRQWHTDPPLLLRFSDEQRVHLETAEDAATRALDGMKEWEARTLTLETLCNRAAIREALGKIDGEDGALSDCKAALAISPDNPVALLTNGEILLHHKRDSQAAISFLSRVASAKGSEGEELQETGRRLAEDAAVLCAEAHVNLKEWPQVIALLEPLYRPDPARRDQMDLARLLAQAAFFLHDTARLEVLKRDLEMCYLNDAAAMVTLADLARYEEDFPRYATLMQQAYDLSEGHHRNRAAYLLGQARALNGEFVAAIDLLRPLVDLDRVDRQDPDLTLRLLLEVLNLAARKPEAHDLAVRVRGGGRAVKAVSEYEADYAVDQGDAAHALQLLEELSADNLDHVVYARNVAALALTIGVSPREDDVMPAEVWPASIAPEHIEAARTALRRIAFEQVKDEPAVLIDFARLRHKAGFADAPEWAYRAIRIAPNDSDVGGLYLQYVLTEVVGDDARFHRDKVEAESAVELKRRGQSEIWIITHHSTGDPHELTPGHPFAHRLEGKRVGDRLSASEDQPWNRDGYEVVTVKSKYVQAAHDLTQKFESGVLQQDWMTVGHFDMPNTVEGARAERQKLREFLESGTTLAQLYESEPVAIGTVAQLSARIIPDLWRFESPNGGYAIASHGHFLASLGTTEEMQAHRKLVASANALVLDWTALMSIVHLELEEALSQRYKRMVVARALAAEVDDFSRRQQRGDEDFAEEETPPAQRRREFAYRLREFVQNRCEVTDCSLTDADEERAKTHGRSAVATSRIAQEQGLPLWADDVRLRHAARDLEAVSGLGVQAILENLQTRGKISPATTHEGMRRLLFANYGFLWMDKTFVMWVLRRNSMNITGEVRRVLRNLAFWNIRQEVAVALTVGLLIEVCKTPLLYNRRRNVANALLDAVVENRPTRPVVVALLKRLQLSLLMTPTLHAIALELIWTWANSKVQIVR